MLRKYLIAKTNGKANCKNIVYYKDYRITVLSERLFRLEKCENLNFRDSATLSVWYRNMPPQKFSLKDENNSLIITTSCCSLIVKEEREQCRILLDGKLLPLENSGNLLGTCSTLDCCDGDIFHKNWKMPNESEEKLSLENGICSLTGVAVYDDSKSLTLDEKGQVKQEISNGSDEYIFAFKDDYQGAINALYMISGKPPVVPKYALGNWWSRYYVYSDREYLKVLNYFEEENVPLTVATIDMDWHYSKAMESDLHISALNRNTPEFGGSNGWTGYTWNKRLFPNPKEFLKKIHKKNLKITLNLHPADGVRWWEFCYEDMANAMGINPETCHPVPFKISDPKFINSYFEKIHRPLEKEGVDFWWIDWQQGSKSELDGLNPLWALNHYHYLESEKFNKNPLILSRYCGLGSHRYPLGFSGDTFITWNTLKFLPYFTATSTNIGYTWWSHDIGGHTMGEKDDELYIRHLQFGVFSPINRLHSANFETCTKEPWAYTTGAIAKEFLRLRHSLISFLYTCSYNTNKLGIPLIKPLYYDYKNSEAYNYRNEYIFGNQLLVLPISEKVDKKELFAVEKMWIPKGKWTDIFTGFKYDGGEKGKEINVHRTINSIPVLIKEGGILPLARVKDNSIKNPKCFEIKVYKGNGNFTLYENGDEINKSGEFFTCFESKSKISKENSMQTLEIKGEGNVEIIPKSRIFKLRFCDIKEGKVEVFENGKHIKCDEILTSCVAVDVKVNPLNSYKIVVTYKKPSKIEDLIDFAKKVLTIAQGKTKDKLDLFAKIKNIKTIDEYKKIVEETSLISQFLKDCLFETI